MAPDQVKATEFALSQFATLAPVRGEHAQGSARPTEQRGGLRAAHALREMESVRPVQIRHRGIVEQHERTLAVRERLAARRARGRTDLSEMSDDFGREVPGGDEAQCHRLLVQQLDGAAAAFSKLDDSSMRRQPEDQPESSLRHRGRQIPEHAFGASGRGSLRRLCAPRTTLSSAFRKRCLERSSRRGTMVAEWCSPSAIHSQGDFHAWRQDHR